MSGKVQGMQSFARSMDVLQEIADAPIPPEFSQLFSESSLTRPTLHRILAALEAEGLVEQIAGKRYRLGARVVMLARKSLADNDIRQVARPYLERLRSETGETVHLAVRSGDCLVYIDKIESMEIVRMASTIGTRVPFHSSGVGKAYLSALGSQDAGALIKGLDMKKITRFTTTSRTKLEAIVQEARRRGFVFDDQENEEGVVCYGAAICDDTHTPVASVSVSVPLFRHSGGEEFYAKPLCQCVDEIARAAGYG
ncbi:MAG: IclR family transcriptional regulator [Hyphomicrobiales bacterium]